MDAEARRILQQAYEQGVDLLRTRRRELDRLAAALLEWETLEEAEILRVTGLARAQAFAAGRVRSSGGHT